MGEQLGGTSRNRGIDNFSQLLRMNIHGGLFAGSDAAHKVPKMLACRQVFFPASLDVFADIVFSGF